MQGRCVILILFGVLCAEQARAAAPPANARTAHGKPEQSSKKRSFEKEVLPLLSHYCYGCHGEKKKGDLDLRIYTNTVTVARDRHLFEKVLKNLQAHEMPPEKKPQPTAAERELITQWINAELLNCDCTKPDPGRVTIRRLNRSEYNNTIRDLVGVNFRFADDFPADDVGYGFDNIGDVLSLPPILLEKYMAAAEKILAEAIVTEDPARCRTNRFWSDALEATNGGAVNGKGWFGLFRESDAFVIFRSQLDADYVFRVKAYGQQAGAEPVRMAFRVNQQQIKIVEVTAVEEDPNVFEAGIRLQPGTNLCAVAYLNNYFNALAPDPAQRDRNLFLEYLELEGPLRASPQPLPETHRRIFIRQPTPETARLCAREIIGRFAKRAYRRPVTVEELDRLMKLFELAGKGGERFEQAVKVALQAVLVSPYFLFRGELQPEPNNPSSVHPIGEFALASRLSYFLWSSMPDDELFALAERKKLRRDLQAQVRRMLNDPKAEALVDNFAGQWLQIRNLEQAAPDPGEFPAFDDKLRGAMQEETKRFFADVMRKDFSVLTFLDANYSFLNERLARHYGIAGVRGDQFQRVIFKNGQRGGLLTHASILTITSNPTRTSPVKRGKWILENILGTPPPPPPPEVPELKDGKDAVLAGTLRQRMEQHRANPSCASCHARMDPLGFGLENFDGIGAWRDKDGAFPIDPSGELGNGESFLGPGELKALLLKRKRNEFIRCLSEKMLTYALGRGLEYYDKCAIDKIANGMTKDHYKFSSLIDEVVKSTPFQMLRGEGQNLGQAKQP